MKNATYKTLIATLAVIAIFATSAVAGSLKVYAPSATSVEIKGAQVELVRDGNYVIVGNSTAQIGIVSAGSSTSSQDADVNPELNSVSPNNGRGVAEIFKVNVSDNDGADNIKSVEILIHRKNYDREGVYMVVNFTNNTVSLRDQATGKDMTARIGSSSVLENGLATISASGVKIVKNGTRATVSLPVSFDSSNEGPKFIYAGVEDKEGNAVARKIVGSYTVETQKPRVVSVESEIINQDITVITATFEDLSGSEDISDARLVINDTLSGSNSIYLKLDTINEIVSLRNDNGSAWIVPGAKKGKELVNSEAHINTDNVRFIRDGENLLKVIIPVEFSGSAELKKFYAKVSDLEGYSTNWVTKGEYEVADLTVSDNKSLDQIFGNSFKKIEKDIAGENGLHRFSVIKNRMKTDYTALVGEELVSAADLETLNGKTLKLNVGESNVDAVQLDNNINGGNVVRLNGELADGLRLVYRYRHSGKYQFIEARRDAETGALSLVSGYVEAHKETIRKVEKVEDKGLDNELVLTLNSEDGSMNVNFNEEDVFGGTFKSGISGDVALFASAGQLDVIYSQMN